MRIVIVTPAPPRSQHGNRVTAQRWARILRALGHRVIVSQAFEGAEKCDLLVALHAKRSAADIARFRRLRPDSPLVLALTGTDLYGDIHHSAAARRSLELADRLVLLQPHGLNELAPHLHGKSVVIYQSFPTPQRKPKPLQRGFEVTVIGHLRPVKDPFRAAMAVRRLPPSSRIQVTHLGGCMSLTMRSRAEAEMQRNPRYRWLGERSRGETLRFLSRSRVLVLSSKSEGGANVVSEAIAASTPVVSTYVSGSIGLLGEDYPGYFAVGDTEGLRTLLTRVEAESDFYNRLAGWCERLKPLVDPKRERESWKDLIESL